MDESDILSIAQYDTEIESDDDCNHEIEQSTTDKLRLYRKRSWIWKYFKPVSLEKAKCHMCSQIYSFAAGTTSNLFRHLKIKHKTGLKEYEEEMDKKRSELWKHFSNVEDDKNKVQCDYCQQIISIAGGSRGNMTRHLKKKHSKINIDDSTPFKRKFKRPVKLENSRKSPEVETEIIEEEPEELELVIETKSGIVMNYKTTRRKLNFDLENKLLKNVKLVSKNEVLLIQTSDEKLNISLGGPSKIQEETPVQGYQPDHNNIQPRNLVELLNSENLEEGQEIVVVGSGVPAEDYCLSSYENCAVHESRPES